MVASAQAELGFPGDALAGTLHARGLAGLLRDKTRRPGKAPTPAAIVQRVIDLATADPPGETTHSRLRLMTKTIGIGALTVPRLIQRISMTGTQFTLAA